MPNTNFALVTQTLTGNGSKPFTFPASLGTLQSYVFGITGMNWNGTVGLGNPQSYSVSFTVTASGNTITLQQNLSTWLAPTSTTTVTMLGAFTSNGVYLSVQRPTPLGTAVAPVANPASPPLHATGVISGFSVGFAASSSYDLVGVGAGTGVATVITPNGGMGVGMLGYGLLVGSNACDFSGSNVTTGFIGLTQPASGLGLSLAPAWITSQGNAINCTMPGLSSIDPAGYVAFIQSFNLSFNPLLGSCSFDNLSLGTSNLGVKSGTTTLTGTMNAGLSGTVNSANHGPVSGKNPLASYLLVAIGTPAT